MNVPYPVSFEHTLPQKTVAAACHRLGISTRHWPEAGALAQSHAGYSALCRLITDGRRAAVKGSYHLSADDFSDGLAECLLLWVPGNQLLLSAEDSWILDVFHRRLWIAVELLADGLERQRLGRLQQLGQTLGVPLVASGDVHMHCRERRILQDTLTVIREGLTLDQAGYALYPNGERYLRNRGVIEKCTLRNCYRKHWKYRSPSIFLSMSCGTNILTSLCRIMKPRPAICAA